MTVADDFDIEPCRANPKTPHICAYATYGVGSDCKDGKCLYKGPPKDVGPDTQMTPDLEVWVRNQRGKR